MIHYLLDELRREDPEDVVSCGFGAPWAGRGEPLSRETGADTVVCL